MKLCLRMEFFIIVKMTNSIFHLHNLITHSWPVLAGGNSGLSESDVACHENMVNVHRLSL